MKRIIAVDFDGTLCENKYPKIGKPRTPIINAVKEEKKSGAMIILWTCREGDLLSEALEWCSSFGLEFDSINDNPKCQQEEFKNNPRKVGATEYWDDKGVNLSRIYRKQTLMSISNKIKEVIVRCQMLQK